MGLAEVPGHLGVPEGGRHGRGRLGEQEGHLPELLQVDEQPSDSIHGDSCHGAGGSGGYRVLGSGFGWVLSDERDISFQIKYLK